MLRTSDRGPPGQHTRAQLLGALPRNVTLGAHDLIIGATALAHGFALLTANVADFSRMPGVVVVPFESAT